MLAACQKISIAFFWGCFCFFSLWTFAQEPLESSSKEEAGKKVVSEVFDLFYYQGKEQHPRKHQLDLYVPNQTQKAPILIFIHGGTWIGGDRRIGDFMYQNVGNAFAQEGFLVVIPSYRFAPRYPFPASMVDLKRVLAFVDKNIEEHGGDPSRIFISGHSSGAHLAALLALDPKWIPERIKKNIQGLLCCSGVYDLNKVKGSGQYIFGSKIENSSPVDYLRKLPFPVHISVAEKDPQFLLETAYEFKRGLEKQRQTVDFKILPNRNHLNMVVSIGSENDPTTKAITNFIKKRCLSLDLQNLFEKAKKTKKREKREKKKEKEIKEKREKGVSF